MRRIALTAALVVLAQPAAAFVAENNLRVNPLPTAGTFEVVAEPGSGPREYWCAAAHYTRQALGVAPNSRIFVLDGPRASVTRPGSRAVAFTLRGPAEGRRPGQDGNYALSVSEPGFNISGAHAAHLCPSRGLRDPEWPL